MAALDQALVEVNTNPEAGIAALEQALAALGDFAPALARDPETRTLRVMAQLALARAQLASGDHYAASATIDATLETLGDIPLDPAALGPSLGGLVEQRQRLLDARGQARLRVSCDEPCRVLIDERNVGEVERPGSARELALPLGHHRIWVEPLNEGEGASASWRASLELDSADTTTELRFPAEGGAIEAGEEVPAPRMIRPGGRGPSDALELDAPRRIAPRWAEATTLSVGAAALVAGAVLWALDSRCPGGADINDPIACPELYDTKTVGIALASSGLAATLTGGVMLVVDETRAGDRRGRELALVWTTRF